MYTSGNPKDLRGGEGLRHCSSDHSPLSTCFKRYLTWLIQLQSTIDVVSDDAYTLDRLARYGLLPLRQRVGTVPAPMEARLRTALSALLLGVNTPQACFQLQDGQRGTKGPQQAFGVTEASPMAKSYPYSFSRDAAYLNVVTTALTHAEAPPCPCRAFFEQLQREADDRLSALQQKCDDDERESDRLEDSTAATDSGHGSFTDKETTGGQGDSGTPCLSASASNFATRLKDAIRGPDGGKNGRRGSLSALLAAKTVILSSPTSFHPRGTAAAAADLNTRNGSIRDVMPTQPLLPIALEQSSQAASDSVDETDNEASTRQRTHSASVPFFPSPVPVAPATQSHRTLHTMLAHIAPDDLRRCALCSGQLLIESVWHVMYQLQLITLLSAAPSMAAPLPLPPSAVLRIHPTEALFLLYHCAHRAFGLGVTLAITVGVPSPSPSVMQMPEADTFQSALDMLRGGCGGSPHASFLAPGKPGGSSTSAQPAEEERAIWELSSGLLDMVESITGTVAPYLWPREHVSTARTASLQPIQEDATGSVVGIVGDILALRFDLFHAVFGILMKANSSRAALQKLVSASGGLLRLVWRLQARWFPVGTPAEIAEHYPPSTQTSTDGVKLSISAVNTEMAPASVEDIRDALVTTLGATFALLDTLHMLDSAKGSTCDDEVMALIDDVRALCCVAALLGVFAELVYVRETLADGSGCFGASPSLMPLPQRPVHCQDIPHQLLDRQVFPCLQRLQSSTRGHCSAQARQLIALWWLLRADTVRQWVWISTGQLPSGQRCEDGGSKEKSTHSQQGQTMNVLGVTISLRESPNISHLQHWSLWLKEASRAALRASDAASEFLGLSLIPSTASAASQVSASFASSALAAAASTPPPLRWRSPVQLPSTQETSPTSTTTAVNFLPLPWIRLWLLLCHPLFSVSPADILMLRQRVQLQRDQEGRGAPLYHPAERTQTAKVPCNDATVAPRRRDQASIKDKKTLSLTRSAPPSYVTASSKSTPGIHLPPRGRAHRTPNEAKAEKIDPPPEPPTFEATSAAIAPQEPFPTKEELLQQRFFFGTEPVCFWLRWSSLFISGAAVGHQPSPSLQTLMPPTPQSHLMPSADSGAKTGITAAITKVIAWLQKPSLILRHHRQPSHQRLYPQSEFTNQKTVPSTKLIGVLHDAFPLYSPADLLEVLQAQGRLFLPPRMVSQPSSAALSRSGSAAPTQSGIPSPRGEERNSMRELFASYSFAASIGALRESVEANIQAAKDGNHV